MASGERYFIGPNVRSKLTDLFTRVDGMPVGAGQGPKIPVALQDMRRPGATGRVQVRIANSNGFVTSGNVPLDVGQGFPLSVGTLVTSAENASNNVVSSEDDLPVLDAASGQTYTSPVPSYLYSTSRCGIIESVKEDDDNASFKIVTVLATGIVRCRVLVLNDGPAALPPAPYPSDTALRQYWRRYLTTGEYGFSSILAVGSKFWLNGANNYPYIAECLVHLG